MIRGACFKNRRTLPLGARAVDSTLPKLGGSAVYITLPLGGRAVYITLPWEGRTRHDQERSRLR